MLKLSKSEIICVEKILPHYYKHFVEILNKGSFRVFQAHRRYHPLCV
jgi:hypothetical protein